MSIRCEKGGKDGVTVEKRLLLLRNLYDNKTPRFLDIKIMDVTAVGGWKGKGSFGAARHKCID